MTPDTDFWTPAFIAAIVLMIYSLRRLVRGKKRIRVVRAQRTIVRRWPPVGKGY